MGLDLAAEIQIGDLATKDDLAQLRADLVIPCVLRPIQNSVIVPASGATVLDLGAPSQAAEWDLRSLTVVGADDHTPSSNVSVALYVASMALGGDPPTLQQLAWVLTSPEASQTLPVSDRWKDQIRIPGGQHLYAVFTGTGVTAGLSFTASGWVGEKARK